MTALTEAPPVAAQTRRTDALPQGRARTIALFSLFLASTMELLDTTIVNIALPSIETGLGATGAQLQWMVAAYPLAFAVALITGSRLGDLWGRKRLFVAGLVGFTLMSAACGIAPTAETLILFRALQGLAAAAMIPQVLTSIQVMYAPHERAGAMGLFTALAGVTAVVGPVLGAVLTNADIAGTGWRSIFLVNIPVGIVAVVAAVKWVPDSVSERRPGIDVRGVLVLAAGLLAVLYPLTMGRELGWPVWGYALMAGGAAVLIGFVRTQRRTERDGGEPLVNLSLYQLRSFGAGSGVHGLLFVAMGATFLCQTVYLQAGLGWTVLHAGLAGLPFAVATSVFAGVGMAVLVPRIGTRVLPIGALIWAAGAVLLLVTVHGAMADTSTWAFMPGFVVSGAGFGLMVAPIGMFTISDVPVHHAGSASGLLSTTGQLGSAVGVAVVGTVFFSVVDSRVGALPSEMFRPAFEIALIVLVALMVVSAVVARALPNRPAPAPSGD
jgi:EmrB/QacA subfamily drug resistance transporter